METSRPKLRSGGLQLRQGTSHRITPSSRLSRSTSASALPAMNRKLTHRLASGVSKSNIGSAAKRPRLQQSTKTVNIVPPTPVSMPSQPVPSTPRDVVMSSAKDLPDSVADQPPDNASNILVAVRVRPENDTELNGCYRKVVEIVDDVTLVFDPPESEDDFFFRGKKQGRRDLNKKPSKNHSFSFDAVFGPDSTTEQVYEKTTRHLIDVLFRGYNASVFVYGATGAGKTHTMIGSATEPGLTFRTVMELYRRIEETKSVADCQVAMSYAEVYNEAILDLMNPGKSLVIREDSNLGVNIPGLSVHRPADSESLLQMLRHGNNNRTQHPTDANAQSSRSHAIFQVFVKIKSLKGNMAVQCAKLSMVDLAGSEKACVAHARGGDRLREGANINKSLLALGNCINALAESSKYIPYRNSKLTRMLKDSIGGSCRTVMISNVSPSSMSFDDTYNTLKYADRAKKIKVKLRKNMVLTGSDSAIVAHYTKLIEKVKSEVEHWRQRALAAESMLNASNTNGSQTATLAAAVSNLDETRVVSLDETRVVDRDSEADVGTKVDEPATESQRLCEADLRRQFQSDIESHISLLRQTADGHRAVDQLLMKLECFRMVKSRIHMLDLTRDASTTHKSATITRLEKAIELAERKRDHMTQSLAKQKARNAEGWAQLRNRMRTFVNGEGASNELIKRSLYVQMQSVELEVAIVSSKLAVVGILSHNADMHAEKEKSDEVIGRCLSLLRYRELTMISYGHSNDAERKKYQELANYFNCEHVQFSPVVTSSTDNPVDLLGPIYAPIVREVLDSVNLPDLGDSMDQRSVDVSGVVIEPPTLSVVLDGPSRQPCFSSIVEEDEPPDSPGVASNSAFCVSTNPQAGVLTEQCANTLLDDSSMPVDEELSGKFANVRGTPTKMTNYDEAQTSGPHDRSENDPPQSGRRLTFNS